MSLYSDLYDIIKTFDKNEKRQFKLRIGGQTKTASDYGKLFDYFSGLEQWDEAAQQEILRKRWGARLLTLCKGLETWLLRALEDMQNETKYQQLWHKLLQVEVLFHRSLHKQAWQILESLKADANQVELSVIQLFVFNFRSSFFRSPFYNFPDMNTLQEVDAYLEEAKQYVREIENTQNYHNQLFRLVFYYSKGQQSESTKQEIDALMQQPMFQSVDEALTIPGKMDFYYCQQFYHLAQRNYKAMLDAILQLWAFLESLPDCYFTYYKTFYGLWMNIFIGAAQSSSWDILLQYYKKLQDDLPKLPTVVNFAELLQEPGEYALLLMYYKTNQYDILHSKLDFYAQFVAEWQHKLSLIRVGQFAYWLGLIWYEKGNFAKACEWIQPYTQPKHKLAAFPLRVAIRFLWLVIHYQQEEYHYLPYAIRQFYRWFQQHATLSGLQKTWLSFLRNAALKADKNSLLRKLHKLEKMLDNPSALSLQEKELLFYFPLEKWIGQQKRRLKAD